MGRQSEQYAAAVAALEKCPPPMSRWRHRSGGIYRVTGPCLIEATLAAAVAYVSENSSPENPLPIWVRPLDEFLDGRFERLPE